MSETTNMSYAEVLIDLYKRLLGSRQNFETYWQSLHDYFYIESTDINTQYAKGSELNSTYLYDSTTLDAGDVLASGFMNYLTPPTSKWARLVHKDQKKRGDKEIQSYLEDVTDEVHYALNRSNFYNQMFPTYKGSGVYGTQILLEEEDIEDGIRFYNLPIKQCIIVEDGRGRVAEFFIEFEWTAGQAADRFGLDQLAQNLKEEYAQDKQSDKKHKFLLHIAKRSRRDVKKSNKENLPIGATWLDYENRTVMKESGYHEMPAFAHRFDKRPFIEWGFSPAMKALPFARMLNAIAKTNLRMMMKHTDPPIAVPQNAFMMPFNMNPRAYNIYDPTKMKGGSKDIFAFGNYGNPEVGMTALEHYTNQVNRIMYNDVFLAFNQLTKQMNNPEVAERIAEKMTLLGPSVGRYISELLNPIIIRTVGILARAGRLPEPPDAMLENPEYEIDIISQLSQAQKRSELNALLTGLQLVGQVAQFKPEVIDKINGDRTIDESWGIIGSPTQVLNSDDEVQEIRDARARVAQQQQAMNITEQGANVVEKGTKADVNAAKAQETVTK